MSNKEVYYNKKNSDFYPVRYENVIAQEKSKCKSHCASVDADHVGECDNDPAAIVPITTGVAAVIPVVLAELTVRFNVSSKITLPEAAVEVKQINKKLKITQCLLLQDTNILFIKGFVRKSIDFATRNCSTNDTICGHVRHCTIDVPFECTTSVDFNGTAPELPIPSTSTEFEYFRRQGLPNTFAEKDKLLSSDLSEFNQISTEYFNNLPFCKLISSRIVEFDEFLNRERPYHSQLPIGEELFTKLEEKMVIALRLQILQERTVAIGPTVEVRNSDNY